MRNLFPLLGLTVSTIVPVPEKQVPVSYSFTALAVAYFDKAGCQVGNVDITSTAPERIPEVGETVFTDKEEYLLTATLGEGTDSRVFKGVANGKEAAVKFQMYPDYSRQDSVETDFRILSIMNADGFGDKFPSVYFLSELGALVRDGEIYNLRYLVMQLLGSPVLALLKDYGHTFPIHTVASIGIQVTEILEKLHSASLIHGDIHLENILFTYDATKVDEYGQVYTDRVILGDYGKSVPYKNSNGDHIQNGAIEISSKRNLLHLSPYELNLEIPSRREDIFRMMESLVRMCGERQYTAQFRGDQQNNRLYVLNAKLTADLSNVFPNMDKRLIELYNYSRKMAFEEVPNYVKIRSTLIDILTAVGRTYDNKVILPNQ